eukprot:scaffold53229_cov51-Phaeocystis_antarctica.AAC.1
MSSSSSSPSPCMRTSTCLLAARTTPHQTLVRTCARVQTVCVLCECVTRVCAHVHLRACPPPAPRRTGHAASPSGRSRPRVPGWG